MERLSCSTARGGHVEGPGRRSPLSSASEQFPAAVYSETVLAVNFEDAKKYFFDALIEIHAAHTLMLRRQGIIPQNDARGCLAAVKLRPPRDPGGAL